MRQIYISIAVLLQGAYCTPIINTANTSCTIVIKRFDEPVTTLEVKWGSTIQLVCDASCTGPRPGLSWWYYRTQTKATNIEKLFRSPKFETYPKSFHRKNVLVIRNFGPNEEATFICIGSPKTEKLKAEVKLRGTDCLQKYEFRCKVDKRCIDRGYLCNKNVDCPDGEDEFGCEFGYPCPEGKQPCKKYWKCFDDSKRCDGVPDCADSSDEEDCSRDSTNGNWSEWENISLCYAKSCNNSCSDENPPCEKGDMEQIRFCNNPSPRNGGKWCHGQLLRKVKCENHLRPGWSEWGPVTCDKDCRSSEDDTVFGSRERTCNNPPPIHKSDDCCGQKEQTTDDDPTLCIYLPLCKDTTVPTTTTSATSVTCQPIKRSDSNDHYEYMECEGQEQEEGGFEYENGGQ